MKSLLTLLTNYQADNQHEADMVQATLAFVRTHHNCFERTLLIGHITAGAWIIDKTRTYALLLHHKKLNQWFQPGGHCDGDPDVLHVALKEVHEETGIIPKVLSKHIFDVDIHLIPERKGVPEHLHYDIRFLLEADKDTPLLLSDESNELAWIPLAAISHYNSSESVLRMVRKSLKISRAV